MGKDNFFAGLESYMEIPTKKPELEAKETTAIVVDGRNQPYCQVVVNIRPDGSKLVKAYLQGEILDVDEYVELIDSLLAAKEGDQFYIYIDSPGGYISAGSIISSAIASCAGEVTTVARGLCASAACLIHNSAKEGHALVADMGVLMIHFSSHMDTGNSSLIEKRAADQVRYVTETLLSQAVEMGYLTSEELSSIQTGTEIFISSKDFTKRIELKRNGETPTEKLEGAEAFESDIPVDQFGQLGSDTLIGMESLNETMISPQEAMMRNARMLKANALRIKTTDRKNFRIYIPSDMCFSRTFVSNLCMFLDSRTEDQTVTFVLGAKVSDRTTVNVGGIISAMQSCKAKIITLAAGYCSIPETMLWCFGAERKVMRYGAMTFGITRELIQQVPKYADYFEIFLNRAKEIGILNDEEIEKISKHNQTKFLTHKDFK